MKRAATILATLLAGVLGLAVTTAAAAVAPSPDPATQQAVSKWVQGGGQKELEALGTDFRELEAAANANDLGAMETSCQHLKRDVDASQAYDPIPDAQAQASWAKALDQYEKGADHCIKGAATAEEDLLIQASTEIVAGSDELQKVSVRLKEIAG